MAVPNTFATATSAIPLANLDANFAYYDGAFSISGAATTFSGAVTLTSNLTFTGTGNRITGDFSNATHSNRVLFQTSTTNGSTIVGVIPNGTSTTAQLNLYNNSDPTNASLFQAITGTGEVSLRGGNTGTGTFLPMTFYTGGSERMRLDTSGNVGIGTSSPAGKLEVSGGRSWFTANSELYSIAFRYSSSTGVMYMGATNSVSTPSIQFSNSGGTALATIDYSGNMGIGQTSPQAKLQINTAADGAQIIVVGAQTANEQTLLFRNSYYTNNATGGIAAIGWIDSGSSGGSLTFKTGTNGGGVTNIPSEKMRIDQAGNVGIGTSSPSYKLDVLMPSSGAGVQFRYTGGTNNPLLRFTTTEATRVSDINASASTSGILTFSTDSAERMRINSSGQVGIGTSAPTGQLDVRTAAGVVAQSNLYTGSNAAVVKFNIGQVGTIDWDIGLNATAGNFYIGGLGGSMAEAYKIVRTGTSIDYQTWNTGGAERMRIDSSGNVLVGATAKLSAEKVLINAANASGVQQGLVINNPYGYGTGLGTAGTALTFTRANSSSYNPTAQIYSGNTIETTSNFGYLAFATQGTSLVEAMRIDSSGNVGIGTTSPARKLDVRSSGGTVFANVGNSGNDNNGAGITFTGSSTTKNWFIGNQFNVTGAFEFTQTTANGGTSPAATPSMVIDSSGNLLVGTSATINTNGVMLAKGGAAGGGIIQLFKTASGGTNGLLNYYQSTYVGGINYDNTSTSVATSSDIRLKKDIVDAPSAINVTSSIRVVSHGWKHDESTVRYGFVAQELINVAPEAVMQGNDGEKIEKTWTVDYARLVPMLVKTIQEQQALITSLTARIEALESR